MFNKKCQVCPGGDTKEVFYDATLLTGTHGYLCEPCFKAVAQGGYRYELMDGTTGLYENKGHETNKVPARDLLDELGIC